MLTIREFIAEGSKFSKGPQSFEKGDKVKIIDSPYAVNVTGLERFYGKTGVIVKPRNTLKSKNWIWVVKLDNSKEEFGFEAPQLKKIK
jgi:ribosomal protein L21E